MLNSSLYAISAMVIAACSEEENMVDTSRCREISCEVDGTSRCRLSLEPLTTAARNRQQTGFVGKRQAHDRQENRPGSMVP